MSHHDDMFDAEPENAELNCSRRAMQAFAFLIGRDKVRNVAQDEDLPRLGIEDRRRIDPAVAAGNDHYRRRLAFDGKRVEARLLVHIGITLETAITFDETGEFWHRRPISRHTFIGKKGAGFY